MSHLPASAPAPSRPGLFAFLLVLGGVTLSLGLTRLAPLTVEVTRPAPDARFASALDFAAEFLPVVMRLPEGVILLWPLFFLPQRLFGREQGLTGGEWLWVLSWVGLAALTGLDAWRHFGPLPDALAPYAGKPRLLWYWIFVPAIAALAVFLAVGGLFARGPAPWTHPLGLALTLWPAPPLAVILFFGDLK